jgi:hypothetical protein
VESISKVTAGNITPVHFKLDKFSWEGSQCIQYHQHSKKRFLPIFLRQKIIKPNFK